jgi:hypothetical protein
MILSVFYRLEWDMFFENIPSGRKKSKVVQEVAPLQKMAVFSLPYPSPREEMSSSKERRNNYASVRKRDERVVRGATRIRLA